MENHIITEHNICIYNIQSNLIRPSESVKDLGVITDDKIKFHDHVTSVTAKANRTLAIIKSPSISQVVASMHINLYKSLVRPVIEYGNVMYLGTTLHSQSSFCRTNPKKSY